jgi:hypothetical protein
MKFCDCHWEKLRTAIAQRGLMHLVARNGEEALKRLIKDVEGTAKELDYDPLMSCAWMIYGHALKIAGSFMLTGDWCPVCLAAERGADELWWISWPADAALQYCKENQLLMTDEQPPA